MIHEGTHLMRIPGIVAASGLSERMGTPKALLDATGQTFLQRILGTLREGGCDPTLVVLRTLDDPVADEARRNRGVLVLNPEPSPGPISSLKAGLQRLPAGTPAVLFTPVDHPLFTSSTVTALIRGFEARRAPAVLPTYQGRRGHPVLFSQTLFEELSEDSLQEGARTVLRRYVGLISEVPVGDPGILAGIDTWDDYRRHFP